MQLALRSFGQDAVAWPGLVLIPPDEVSLTPKLIK